MIESAPDAPPDQRDDAPQPAQAEQPSQPTAADPQPAPLAEPLVRLHLLRGWVSLLVFTLLGITLEGLHAWKSQLYLGVDNETRRLLWTLAHAHGIGLALLQLGFAATLGLLVPRPISGRLRLASRLLGWASVLVPLGFFLGGLTTYGADPGLGVLLVPVGALALVVALVCVVMALRAEP